MSLADVVIGPPLASSAEREQRIGWAQGIPTFGLDALSSAAYGPEAALTVLLPLGAAAPAHIFPLTAAIVMLLTIVYFSYRQTVAAYPNGGGSYTVAKENLGARLGVLAASALMIDYILNVAVGISAGVGALVSAVPALQPRTLTLCLALLALLTIVNLRGAREPGVLFLVPTAIFAGCLLATIAWGAYAAWIAGGHPRPVTAPPRLGTPAVATPWLLLRAFASGCTAMTGVEAVSNGVQAFREPVVRNARRTLTAIIALLVVLLLGIAWLARAYRIGATPPGQAGYQSVLSQITGAVAGHGVLYSVTIGSILAVLCLSANTSFSGFPQLCRAVAADGYLPRSFADRGRRLVYSEGIWVLAILSAGLLVLFGGVTDRLIPLFAVGALLAFTLSQAGMVAHWKKRSRGRGARGSMWINGIGAAATGATLLVVLTAKFTEGAWVVTLLAPAMLMAMRGVRAHYARVARQTSPRRGFLDEAPGRPIVVVPIETWNSITQKALRFALTISDEVEVVHVEYEGVESDLRRDWKEKVEAPARAAGLRRPRLTVVQSPYRYVIRPIVDYVLKVEREHPDRVIAVVIPGLVERRWWSYLLHNQRGKLLTALLLAKGERRIAIVNVPWYLRKE